MNKSSMHFFDLLHNPESYKDMENTIGKELERAVRGENVYEVKLLLRVGGKVNLRLSDDDSTLLHHARSVEIARELLSCGVDVDARNGYNETPLHCAITLGKSVQLIRELLKHGAQVDATNRKGNTSLNLAVKKSNRSLEVIKELLDHGADINIRNREKRLSEDHFTPMDNAVRDLECAKLLIKCSLLMNFNGDYRKIINSDPYKDCRNHRNLSNFLEDSICEIVQMKTEKIKDNLSLYEFVTAKYASNVALYTENEHFTSTMDKMPQILTGESYPIYGDIISAKIKYSVERARLFNRVGELQIYTISHIWFNKKKVVLDTDSAHYIVKYLSNDDLLNLILAFHKQNGPCSSSSKNIVELCEEADTSVSEASPSRCAKCAKLDLP